MVERWLVGSANQSSHQPLYQKWHTKNSWHFSSLSSQDLCSGLTLRTSSDLDFHASDVLRKQSKGPKPTSTAAMRETKRHSRVGMEMPFIISTVEKVDVATRKLIRSHVMQGRKQINRSLQRPRLAITAAPAPISRVQVEELKDASVACIPGRVGGDLSFIRLADEMEGSSLRNIIKFPNMAAKIMSPLVMAIGDTIKNKEWILNLHSDAALLHITAFAVEGFINIILLRQRDGINLTAMLHYQKGMRLLRERFAGINDNEKVSAATCGVVVKLAQAAHFTGDSHVAQQHMQGLRQMIDLNGGLDTFRGSNLLVEIVRCDLTIALLDSSATLFFCQPTEPFIAYPSNLLSKSDEQDTFRRSYQWIQNIDKDLATASWVMRKFCLLVDLGTQTRRRMPADFINDTMMAVMYRLLHMKFADNSIDEAVRFGILAFCHHVFLQWQDVRLAHARFPVSYRECILHLRHVDGVSSELAIWLLMVGAISVFDLSDGSDIRDFFQEHTSKCKIKTWNKMQRTLKSFMWIALLDDHRGKASYDALNAKIEKSGGKLCIIPCGDCKPKMEDN